MSVERFVAVWMFQRAKTINIRRNAFVALVAIITLIAPFMIVQTYVTDDIVSGVCRAVLSTASVQNLWTATIFVYSAGPSIVVVVANLLVVGRLVHLRRKRLRQIRTAPQSIILSQIPEPLPSNFNTPPNNRTPAAASTHVAGKVSDSSQRVTVVIVVVTTVFVVLVTPTLTIYVYSTATGINDDTVWVGAKLAQILDQLQYSVKIFLYLVSSARFRLRVVDLFREHRCRRCDGRC